MTRLLWMLAQAAALALAATPALAQQKPEERFVAKLEIWQGCIKEEFAASPLGQRSPRHSAEAAFTACATEEAAFLAEAPELDAKGIRDWRTVIRTEAKQTLLSSVPRAQQPIVKPLPTAPRIDAEWCAGAGKVLTSPYGSQVAKLAVLEKMKNRGCLN